MASHLVLVLVHGLTESMAGEHLARLNVRPSVARSAWTHRDVGSGVSAMVTGRDVRDGAIGGVVASSDGLEGSLGLVTNGCVTTGSLLPFMAESDDRYDAGPLTLPDVLLGGWSAALAERGADVTDARGLTETRNATVGMFGDADARHARDCLHMSFAADRPASEPSLSEMASRAFEMLDGSRGKTLVVSSTLLDRAVSSKNATRVEAELDAVDATVDALSEMPDTTVVVAGVRDHTTPNATSWHPLIRGGGARAAEMLSGSVTSVRELGPRVFGQRRAAGAGRHRWMFFAGFVATTMVWVAATWVRTTRQARVIYRTRGRW